jgi:hypothetical protein
VIGVLPDALSRTGYRVFTSHGLGQQATPL